MGGAPYFRLKQGGGPTFVTSILQLYSKVRSGLHTLCCEIVLHLQLVVCVKLISPHPLACQTVGNIPFAILTLGGRSFK